MIDIPKTLALAEKEMERLRDAEIVLKFPLVQMVTLISMVQLSLRNPDAPETASRIARKFCDELIDLIGRASPELADFCRLGDENTFGPTGKYPRGKISDDDEGELKMRVSRAKGNVVISFGTSVKWLAMPSSQAKQFAAKIIRQADALAKE